MSVDAKAAKTVDMLARVKAPRLVDVSVALTACAMVALKGQSSEGRKDLNWVQQMVGVMAAY